MSIDERFESFKVAWAAGEDPDPREALQGLEAEDRAQLSALIDAYLARAPARAWNPKEFEHFRSSAFAERVSRLVGEQPPSERLGDLRMAAKLPREQLVAGLAEALDAPERRAKVADYYHRLEWGTLDARRVSGRVFAALGRLLGVSGERVREAAMRAIPPAAGAPAMARTAQPDPAYVGDVEEAAAAAAGQPADRAEHDELDALFLEGDQPSANGE